MKLNQSTEKALNGLAYLAKQADNHAIFISEISKEQEASESYMGKIFQALTKAGIVKSSRGVHGGFSLAKNPKKITFLQVIEAIEGPFCLSQCAFLDYECPRFKTCSLRPILSEIQEKVTRLLSQKTVHNLVETM